MAIGEFQLRADNECQLQAELCEARWLPDTLVFCGGTNSYYVSGSPTLQITLQISQQFINRDLIIIETLPIAEITNIP